MQESVAEAGIVAPGHSGSLFLTDLTVMSVFCIR